MLTAIDPASVIYIDSPDELPDLVEDCLSCDEIALDTEADSLHHYFEKVCLIQVATMENYYVIDPLAIDDLSPFFEALQDKTLIFHGADYDVRMLFLFHDFKPSGDVFDTMLAAQLLGRDRLGLAALVQEFFEVDLPKHGQKYDWSRRPIPASMIEYAANDTRFLHTMKERLTAELEEVNRLDWHREVCARMTETALTATNNTRDPEREWRVKGSNALERQGMEYLKQFWYWRDKQAQKTDRPPFMVMPNQTLVALSLWATDNPGADISTGPRLPRNCKGSRLAALKQALKNGANTPRNEWPATHPPKQKRTSNVKPSEETIKRLQGERNKLAEAAKLPPSVLAPKAALIALACKLPQSRQEMAEAHRFYDWQLDLLAKPFLAILKNTKA